MSIYFQETQTNPWIFSFSDIAFPIRHASQATRGYVVHMPVPDARFSLAMGDIEPESPNEIEKGWSVIRSSKLLMLGLLASIMQHKNPGRLKST